MDNQFPQAFVDSLHEFPGLDVAALLNALRQPSPVSIRYNTRKYPVPADSNHVTWCTEGIYLEQRPVFTLDPLLHAGAYYVQEASSMFLAQLQPLIDGLGSSPRILDLCAAPGGKSTLLASMLPANALLVSNEVIRSRASILQENMSKWGFPNTIVTSADPQKFGALGSFFDLMLIDAPCSGEGMFRKDPVAIDEWSPANVQLCAERQRRIVADAWEALREDGILVYSTCTFNRHENEENVGWITKTLGAEKIDLPIDPAWNIVASEEGYRFYPHCVQGEGFFVSVMRKTQDAQPQKGTKRHTAFTNKHANKNTTKQFSDWLCGEFVFDERNNFVQALPAVHYEATMQLGTQLYVLQAGIPVGELKGKDIVPTAALALSNACNKNGFTCVDTDLTTALHYLRRENVHFADAPNGWLLICYEGLPLGFAKKIGTRTNNGYPLSWRIRMEI